MDLFSHIAHIKAARANHKARLVNPRLVSVSTTAEPKPAKDAKRFLPVRLEDDFKDGKYILKGHLGSGQYSSVWLAEDTQ